MMAAAEPACLCYLMMGSSYYLGRMLEASA